MSQVKEEKQIRKQIDGLSFVKFEWKGAKFNLQKCTLFEPVYIFANRLFEREDKIFKVDQENIENTQKLFQKHSDQLRLLQDFKEYLLSDKEYIHEFVQQKRKQKDNINVVNPLQEQEEQKQDMHQSKLADNQQFKEDLSKQVDMDNLILVINEQSDNKLEKIKQDIHQHPDLKNVINMSHFMNMNKFGSYKDFSTYLNSQLEDLETYYEQKQQTKELKNLHSNKEYIQRALQGQTKIILFKEYKYNTLYIDEMDIDVPFYQNPQIIFVYYAIAAKDIPDFNEIANRLHYYHKSSPYSIFSNIQERLKQITFNTIKDAIRLSLTKDLQDKKYSDEDGIHQIQPSEYQEKKLDMWNSQEDCENLVYKNICSYGLLPVNVYLNNQDMTKTQNIRQKVLNAIFKKFKSMPYPPGFHINIQVMDKFYSYTRNSLFNCYDTEYKEKFLSYYYTKIRVLDFFPLDQWVEKLAAHFKNNIIPQMKTYFQKVKGQFFSQVDNNYENKELSNNVRHYYLKEIMNQTDTIQMIKDISYQFLKEYFSELKVFQKWSQILTDSESPYRLTDNNCQTGISELVNYLTNVFEEHYESCDEAYNLSEFIYNLKSKYLTVSQISQDFKEKCQSWLNFERPFTNSIYNLQSININELIQQEDYIKLINDDLLKKYQRFSSSINKDYLDIFMEPLIFETPIPKYKYFCEKAHKQYIELIQDNESHIEKFFKVAEEFLECQDSTAEDKIQFDHIKEKLARVMFEKNSKQALIEDFNKTHNIIINLIKLAQNKKYGFQNEINEEYTQTASSTQLLNIISVLTSVYDSWYFSRKGRVNLSQDKDPKRKYKKQYQVKDILNELSYYYYNSVRLANEVLFNSNDQFSVIGHLLIKNPAKQVDSIYKKQSYNKSQIKKTNESLNSKTENQ
ncbi:hypothetical protein TTHERM_00558130 (macronuclear) [Tetrahymena thermophila SB210]|uniref:Uncharacterized protein n=1 Tax=Tetrahymena thermophila (strain SB210) TaxID=312017 RepID=I7M9M7_TETTS|nr:hypothetical protein TTHERM_00558130 [Tetrahymena thermophila SB210]EAS02132.2 hypothetical protein TTHERM_00558130 [Tetrahymena thermophila SB210]|eukprot:XP_001022377.2 hypothetical protein TTHERM_00558130 [Tetrahymena thermophila SB210]